MHGRSPAALADFVMGGTDFPGSYRDRHGPQRDVGAWRSTAVTERYRL